MDYDEIENTPIIKKLNTLAQELAPEYRGKLYEMARDFFLVGQGQGIITAIPFTAKSILDDAGISHKIAEGERKTMFSGVVDYLTEKVRQTKEEVLQT